MANIKSQKKRNRQTVGRTDRNRALRSELKTRANSALLAADSGDAAAAEEALRLAQKRIDSAVSKGLLHRTTAARRKSRLTAQVRSRLG
ncbi:MAG: 30S ribosomal protein S20 [Acidobacteria bacterium]|nr:30S ribosomal protein S20 [Acidobacteriota bacterium]MCH8985456.1 30S ribosomal protein S20 [Acidobacteriota bacterium]